jgi:hypothetical protein
VAFHGLALEVMARHPQAMDAPVVIENLPLVPNVAI